MAVPAGPRRLGLGGRPWPGATPWPAGDPRGWRLGATPTATGTRFLVWAPWAGRVWLDRVDPAGGPVALDAAGDGYWAGEVVGVAPGHRYRYRLAPGPLAPDPRRVEGSWPDPASRAQPDGVHGPSAVVDDAYVWTDGAWPGCTPADLVVYELHVGAFTPTGTLDAAAEHLDELADLGVTAVEVLPLAAFPGRWNWGYDGTFPFAVSAVYGGPDAFARFVGAAHDHGLGVLVDVVYNHFGPEGNVLARFGPYLDRGGTPWGEAVNLAGRGSDHVRRFLVENALWWLDTLHADGLRLDAVQTFVDPSPRPFLADLRAAVGALGDHAGRRRLLIAETPDNDDRLLRLPDQGGIGLDAVWSDDVHHAWHACLTGERVGYYADYGSAEDVAASLERPFVFEGAPSTFHGRRWGGSAAGIPAERFVAFAQNHDQVGNRPNAERLAHLVGFDGARLAACLLACAPWVPLVFMGEEWADPAPFPWFCDFGDGGLRRSVRRGRRNDLAWLGWEQDPPDPLDPATFASAVLRRPGPDAAGGRHAALRALYRHLFALRRTVPALGVAREGDHVEAGVGPGSPPVVWLARHGGAGETTAAPAPAGSEVRAWFRVGAAPAPAAGRVPPGTWAVLVDSAEHRWGGDAPDRGPDATRHGGEAVALRAWQALVLGRLPGT